VASPTLFANLEDLFVRIAYAVTTALLATGSIISLATGNAVTAQTSSPVTLPANLAPRGAPASFADLAERLQPAVVNIATNQKVQVATSFNPFTGERKPITQDQQSGGSGFLISADGYIVTNNHVVAGGPKGDAVDKVTVTLFNGKEYKAEIIGRDPQSDIAVLKIPANSLPYVEMGDSKKSRVGEWVVAIGNPLGLGSTVTAGIISALQRNIGAGGAYDRFIQTDTAINPGNSGGPLFNLQGQVIGINNRLISPTGANIGVGFAIPVDEIVPVVETLKKGARPERGYLGIGIKPVTPELADALGLEKNRGEVIGTIRTGEAAEKAGLKVDDIVLKVGGRDITPEQTLSYLVANIKPGTKVDLDILRKGSPMKIAATVAKRPTEEQIASSSFNPDEEKNFGKENLSADAKTLRDSLGIAVLALDDIIREQLGLPSNVKGVVIDIVGDGTAGQAGMKRGDVIVEANYTPTPDVASLAKAVNSQLEKGRGAIYLAVKRGNGPTLFATVKLDK
jgi:serine protease Do